MDSVADALFNYLRDVLYESASAELDIEKLPEEFRDFARGLKFFAECSMETRALAQALAKGDMSVKLPPPDNEMASPLKSLHSSLMHLTWQTKQVAKGHYEQRVAFMGEFADSFNAMIEQLAERQKKLEDEVALTKKKSAALEQGNHLLAALVDYVPHQIFVIEKATHNILLMNDTAVNEMNGDPEYLEKVIRAKGDYTASDEHEIRIGSGENSRFLIIKSYLIEWDNSDAEILIINDVSDAKNLELHAYHDSMTGLYNRTFGMLTLDEWLNEKRRFVLIFADLDSLKYVNDEFGHNEGDAYIISAGQYLSGFAEEALVCRLGGDEFMLLAPDIGYDEAHAAMSRICLDFKNSPYLKDKGFSYSLSFGIAAVEKDNTLPASDILSIADERMYENKRENKKARHNEQNR